MARPQSISDEEILAIARAVFLEKGIAGTAADVAARAGVAEATVFRRFGTKQALFRAAMLQQGVPEWVRTLPDRVGRGDMRSSLMLLGLDMIAFFRQILPLMMMRMSNPAVAELRMPKRPTLPLRAMKALVEFFAAEIEAGRLPRHDSRVMARVFLGSIHNFVFFEMLCGGEPDMPQEEFLQGLVDVVTGRERKAGQS
jgi:AcrR family transcriptional regulator